MSENLIPAAQYLRMSTEHQQYSLSNQADSIAEYAAANGFTIVRTYSDAAKSGVTLRNRLALQQLLKDVLSKPPFGAILVYDVSRWGRFQDTDEAAHYEFVCKNAGIPVHYCAEPFTSEGTTADLIMKNLKRVMAAEFSRELGNRQIPAKKRLAQKGYLMGGPAPYGTRRMLVSQDGKRKQVLRAGERKSISTDRVILVPGPRSEIEVVRQIFRLVRTKRLSVEAVTEFLNSSGVPYYNGKKWISATVRSMLRNESYIGMYRWGKTTCRLDARRRKTPTEQWIVGKSAFTRIIDRRTFDAVQELTKAKRWTEIQLLEALKDCWRSQGSVSQETLLRVKGAPTYTTFTRRFGSLAKALKLINYRPRQRAKLAAKHSRESRKLHRKIIRKLLNEFPLRLRAVRKPRSPKRRLLLDGRHTFTVLLAMPRLSSFGKVSWSVQLEKDEFRTPSLCCLITPDHRSVVRMYAIGGFSQWQTRYEVKPDGRWLKTAKRISRSRSICRAMSEIFEERDMEERTKGVVPDEAFLLRTEHNGLAALPKSRPQQFSSSHSLNSDV